MKSYVIAALAFAVLLPACKSNKVENVQEMKKQAPDAKPTLHVAEDDPRFVPSAGDTSRQVHYYSKQTDTTYVVDERTGKVVKTFKSKEMPGVVVIDKPAYQPPPLKAEPKSEMPAKEGCSEGSAPKSEGCDSGDKEDKEGCDAEEGEEGCSEGGGE
jgi:hypothetical protein